mmetsp:Transcript_22284/g.53446  ORF Transcript_22284/g.53446 Transcript_22284/m.53446 type:complete len:348 (+) Transcript_22284:3849-4892(+)
MCSANISASRAVPTTGTIPVGTVDAACAKASGAPWKPPMDSRPLSSRSGVSFADSGIRRRTSTMFGMLMQPLSIVGPIGVGPRVSTKSSGRPAGAWPLAVSPWCRATLLPFSAYSLAACRAACRIRLSCIRLSSLRVDSGVRISSPSLSTSRVMLSALGDRRGRAGDAAGVAAVRYVDVPVAAAIDRRARGLSSALNCVVATAVVTCNTLRRSTSPMYSDAVTASSARAGFAASSTVLVPAAGSITWISCSTPLRIFSASILNVSQFVASSFARARACGSSVALAMNPSNASRGTLSPSSCLFSPHSDAIARMWGPLVTIVVESPGAGMDAGNPQRRPSKNSAQGTG